MLKKSGFRKPGVLPRLRICLCCRIPSSQGRPFPRASPQPAFIKHKQEQRFPLAATFPGIMGTPEHASTTRAASAGQRTEYSWKGDEEREGRRGMFLGGPTYSGLLFFSSSESELWWWIQLLSPFRVVRTFICLMILRRSSSVGGMTRPGRGKGNGQIEKSYRARARIQCQQAGRVSLRQQGARVSFQSGSNTEQGFCHL